MCRSEVHFMLPVYPDYGSEMFKKQMTSVSVLPCELAPQAPMDDSRATGGVASSAHLMSQFAQAFNSSAAGSVATNAEQHQQAGFISNPEGWEAPDASNPAERSTALKTPVRILRDRLVTHSSLPCASPITILLNTEQIVGLLLLFRWKLHFKLVWSSPVLLFQRFVGCNCSDTVGHRASI